MQLNKIMMAAVLSFSAISGAYAAGQGSGTVTFTGSIIDAPCSITPETVDQTVPLGQISKAALAANGNTGQSTPKNFQIDLENCDTTTLKSVTTTFTGAGSAYNPDLLGITGTAQGASIVITDGGNTRIKLGTPTKPQGIQDGNNTLLFSAYLLGGGASATVTPGEFTGVADFTLAYQ